MVRRINTMWIYADTLKEVEDMESELSPFYRDEDFAGKISK